MASLLGIALGDLRGRLSDHHCNLVGHLGREVLLLLFARQDLPDLLLDLCVALEETARRTETRAVILAADGEAFSIGGDMRRFLARVRALAAEPKAARIAVLEAVSR